MVKFSSWIVTSSKLNRTPPIGAPKATDTPAAAAADSNYKKDNVKLMICKKKLVCFSFLNQLRDKTRDKTRGNSCDAKEKKQINLLIKKTKELIRKCCQYHYLHVNYFHRWKHFNIAAPCSCKTLATLEPWNQKFWQKKCSAAQLN